MHMQLPRKHTDPIIITTLPHLIAAYIAWPAAPAYAALITASTAASCAWHRHREPGPLESVLWYIDYGLATAWFIADCGYAAATATSTHAAIIILLNAVSMVANWCISAAGSSNYNMYHSIWHLGNVAKATIIAYIISKEALTAATSKN